MTNRSGRWPKVCDNVIPRQLQHVRFSSQKNQQGGAIRRRLSGFKKDGALSRRSVDWDNSPRIQSAEVLSLQAESRRVAPKAHKLCLAKTEAFQLPNCRQL